MDNARYTDLTTQSELDEVFEASHEQAMLVFLHDPWCPISAMASRQVAQVDSDILRVDVSRQHDLSREIERRTGVRHESPQMLLIRDGEAAWHASHSRIDRPSIEQAVAENSAAE